jgi:phage terminase large subunit-like protein
MSFSLAQLIASLPSSERQELLSTLSQEQQEALRWEWRFWARPEQLPPRVNPKTSDSSWRTWLLLSGRGFGKSRTAAEWTRNQIETGKRRSIGLIGPTKEATRKVMVEGVSGLLSICPPWNRPIFEPSNLRLVWPNGAMAHLFTAEEPEKLRGPNLDAAWGDEICAWGTPDQAATVYDMLSLCLRIPGPLGDAPQEILSTTPKPMPLLRQIMKNDLTVVTGGSTFDNAVNLDAATLKYLRDKYEGSRLGRQELYAEVLDAFEGALWSPEMLDRNRRSASEGWKILFAENSGAPFLCNVHTGARTYFKRVVIAIDPAGSANRKSNETGIVATAVGEDEDGYLLEDRSGIYPPEGWASTAIELYERYHADRIVAENNYGGDMVESTIRAVNRSVPVKMLHASKGKRVRAEPVAALDEQGRIHHVGQFDKLEDQLVTWDPLGNGDSPDRLDARVWGFTELMLKRTGLILRPLGPRPATLPIYAR